MLYLEDSMDKNMIATGDWKTFLNLKDEKLLLAIRTHPFSVIFPIGVLISIFALFCGGFYMIFVQFLGSIQHFTIAFLLMASGTVALITKIIIDWFFHVYILTNRKILEFRYTPLMSYVVNDVMLDRVYCTEIDLQTQGWMHDILDMGDIILTFDRPTHQEEFILKDIISTNKVGSFLTRELLDRHPTMPITPMWFNARHVGGRR